MQTEVLKLKADFKEANDQIWEMQHRLNDALSAQEAMRKEMEEVKKAAKQQAKEQSNLNKALIKVSNGFKGMGLAIKAIGFGLIMKAAEKFFDVLMSNQQVADAMNTVFKAIQIVLTQVADVFVSMFKRVSELTGGFDALQKVIGGSFQLAINLVVGAIQGMVLGVQKAQLAWAKFTDSDNIARIQELEANIQKTNEALDVTGQRIKDAGSQIADNFVEAVGEVGTLAQGIAEASAEAIEKVDVKRAISQAKAIVESEKNYELLALQQQRLIEQYDREAETQRQIRDDESKSISERIKANEELGRILQEQGDAEKATVQSRIDATKARIKAEGESVELTNQLYELNTEMIAIDAKLTGLQSEQKTNINALRKEELELTQTQKEVENEIAISKMQHLAEEELIALKRIDLLRQALIKEQEIETARVQAQIDANAKGTQARADAEAEMLRIKEDYRLRGAELDEQELAEKKILEQQKLQIVTEGFGALASILGENSKAGKAAAIAQALMNTYLGVTQVLASKSLIPEPFGSIQKGVSIATVLATGFKAVKDITAVNPKSSSAKPTSSSAPSSTPPSFNIVGSSPTNQLAEAIGSQEQKPVRSYVVSSDVTNAQALDRNIVKSASLG